MKNDDIIITKLKGENWCECMLIDNGLNIGEARYEKDYDNIGSAIFHFEINEEYRRKGYGTLLLKNMINIIQENKVRIIIGDKLNDEGIKCFLSKNGFVNIKPSNLYFAMEGVLAK